MARSRAANTELEWSHFQNQTRRWPSSFTWWRWSAPPPSPAHVTLTHFSSASHTAFSWVYAPALKPTKAGSPAPLPFAEHAQDGGASPAPSPGKVLSRKEGPGHGNPSLEPALPGRLRPLIQITYTCLDSDYTHAFWTLKICDFTYY